MNIIWRKADSKKKKKNKTEFLEIKNTVSELKNTQNRIKAY